MTLGYIAAITSCAWFGIVHTFHFRYGALRKPILDVRAQQSKIILPVFQFGAATILPVGPVPQDSPNALREAVGDLRPAATIVGRACGRAVEP